MAHNYKIVDDIPVGRLFLALDNPRHAPVETEPQAIQRLCEKEDVYPLARDIVKLLGVSPLERFALVPISGKGDRGRTNYFVAEGNRRACALKLLGDPELAPARFRNNFEKLAKDWTPVRTVSGVVFKDLKDVRPWMERLHIGPQGGIGRKSWNAEQKQRWDGGAKNRSAQALLDYAVKEKIITPAEREGKLTTAQRFLSNQILRDTLGVDASDEEVVERTRPKAEFDTLVSKFMRDLVVGKSVNSRMNSPEILTYARSLNGIPNVSATRVDPEPLTGGSAAASRARLRRKAKAPQKIRHVAYDEEIHRALRDLGNYKLESLYHSICKIDLDDNVPLLSVGAWSFFETLTTGIGKIDNANFESFLNKSRLEGWGLGTNTTSERAALGRILQHGNSTKHSSVAANFNGLQLNNDFVTLRSVILKCLEESQKKKS